jgi:pseudouridine kinase
VIKRIAIVGGSCVDIFATSALPLVSRDSNPGTVNIGFGGVGRNIAENLARLGQDATLIAPFGSDPFSAQMLAYTAAAGVHTEHSLIVSDKQTPFYISVNDADGDMAVAVNDMQICERLTPEFLSRKLAVLNACDAVLLDANIPQEAVSYLSENCVPPLFADAVSTKKAMKLVPALPHLFALKTNVQEAEALLGLHLTSDMNSLKDAANRFHAMGIPHIFITLGKNGAFVSGFGKQIKQSAYPVNAVNGNGCGDAFCAAAFLGVLENQPPERLLQIALAAAAVTAICSQAVDPHISMETVQTFIRETRQQV